ncbi:hypothetical protein M758_UG179300 [Ceratodon purpureus]|nr:hypothetical protein M758_UG179300 [Ceratodon purpureus]
MSTDLEKLLLKELDEAVAHYFTVRITSKTRPTRLEVPAAFIKTTGWPGCAQCCLVTSLGEPKE